MVFSRRAASSSVVYASLFHLYILQLVDSQCPKQFQCGNLGNLEFPLANSSGCGLFTVECGARPNPIIHLDNHELSPPYSPFLWILEKLSPNELFIRNIFLKGVLFSNNYEELCKFFSHLPMPHFPESPSISISFFPNITLFKCNKDRNYDSEIPNFREIYGNYDVCERFNIYYPKSNGSLPSPKNCAVLHLPRNLRDNPDSLDLFKRLGDVYHLEWNVSDDCLNCHRGGGNCTTKTDNEFRCDKVTEKRRDFKMILAAAIPGSVVILCLLGVLGFFIWRHKRRINDAYLLSRNISSDPSKSDIEGGSLFFGIPVFTYTELEEATNNFDSSKELGDGGFGTVYYGKLRDGREVAIKRLYEHNYKRLEQFMNEIKILTCLRHPNLVSLYGCTSRRSRELLLVYEYIPNGTVADHIHGDRANEAPLSWPIRMKIAIETACALAYLHASDIIHRDVKTNNLLLDNSFCVKVADFGLSRLFPNDVTHISTAPQGTPGYVDPEYHQCYQLTDRSDVYSFGVVLTELISSMPAVDISRHRHEINLANLAVSRIQRCAFHDLIDPSLGFGSDAEVTRMTTSVAELAFRCLQHEKDLRPSMDEVLAFLKEIRGDEELEIENKMKTNDSHSVPRGVKIPPSPETDDIVLLKSKNLKCSPSAVTDMWISDSTTTSSSG
ncbi:LEAF RUST 10 DISEASE-RESISTANCE LOCUS RECEPTOR-LIKE PROTEIN KINASE-like 1.1 isoform X2 [Olea europaea var. sylvestris]|uniref:LEAF RUST 10 DISEASE-RESISTANCE LOCUS RECEPTOR-LIKE PROTEIN KINASE-like 1.1 isoform X2 n=1 Tax=Olea europaea var. sylvestris TaxID=158386 RepID=UPI000C1CDA4A|nr:LEAF RUST 10 DISEASE-RESISTANCE LOCUS RECEPTOR-LIKE PROTEIN KINASE-like 1.1 isoform X2 [Olea europaea var. sylvestris]